MNADRNDTLDDVEDGEPVTAPDAARRALCLAAVISRANLEWELAARAPAGRESEAGWRAETEALNDWLKSEDLWSSLSNLEHAMLETPAGQIAKQTLIDSTWRSESLCVILWSLGRIERIPAYDREVDVAGILKQLPLRQSTRQFIRNATLRKLADVQDARNEAETWHWRARTYHLERELDEHPDLRDTDFASIVRDAAAACESDGLFVAIEGDYPAFGKAYRDATENEWRNLNSIARERHYGLNWLLGDCRDWEEVSTDT